jgi:NADPH2:quinone reductase
MKAFTVTEYGKPASFKTTSVPTPGQGEILVRITACGLNFADLLMMKGEYQETPPVPFVPGLEICGIVEGLGDGVGGLDIGTQIALFGGAGGLAEYGVFPAERAVPLPDAMPPEIAAGFQVAYGTSHLALTHRARLQPGETLVVLGAAGGVGLTAVEIGKLMGAKVIACARGAAKLEAARAAGADHVLDTDNADLRAEIKALGGADVVYDPVGGDLFADVFRACNPEARVLVIGFASGKLPTLKPNHMLVKNIDVMGFYWGGYLAFRPKALTDSMAELMRWYAEGKLRPHISHVLPLEQTQEALDLLRDRKSTGKVVVRVAEG